MEQMVYPNCQMGAPLHSTFKSCLVEAEDPRHALVRYLSQGN